MSDMDYEFSNFTLAYRMEILLREFPDQNPISLFKEALALGFYKIT